MRSEQLPLKSIPLPAADIEHVLAHTDKLWRELDGERLFITGGTGFFGIWLLASIAAANDALGTRIRATLLSRDPTRFATSMPQLADRPEFTWQMGDVADFTFPDGTFTHLVHLATATSAELNKNPPAMLLHTIAGTQRVLDFARHSGVRRLLLTSSGAIYGPQPADLSHIPEHYRGGPDPLDPASAYAESKRMAELLCAMTPEVECVIARCFAFIGPHLPLGEKFAAGSFLGDALVGKPITLQGDGRAVRSYLYAADLMVWLLTLLVKGRAGTAYNVGSDEAITTLALAERIASFAPKRSEVRILGTADASPAHRYVPDVGRICTEFVGLRDSVPLDDAIRRTLNWLTETDRAS